MPKEILLNKNDISKYVIDTLESLKCGHFYVSEDCFHHNTPYKLVPSILINGLHSIQRQNELGISNYSKKDLELLADVDSHINGINGISLSKINLTDLRRQDFTYDPKEDKSVDIIIDDSINVRRSTRHYGNEFISESSIMPNKFNALDIRLMALVTNTQSIDHLKELERIIIAINSLKGIAKTLEEQKLTIPIREMSLEDNSLLDTTKIMDLPIIRVK